MTSITIILFIVGFIGHLIYEVKDGEYHGKLPRITAT